MFSRAKLMGELRASMNWKMSSSWAVLTTCHLISQHGRSCRAWERGSWGHVWRGDWCDVIWSEPEKRPVWFRQGGWRDILMYTSPKMACLDNTDYKLRSNSAWLIALGVCLKIKDASHKTAFLSEGEREILYRAFGSIPSFLPHRCALCI